MPGTGATPSRSERSSLPLCPPIRRKWPGGWRCACWRMSKQRDGCRLAAAFLIPWQGAGVTGLACSMRGVRSVLGELEAHCLAAFRATVARHRPRWQALGYPVPLMLQHDARHLPLHQIDLVMSSPPYPGMVHARNHIDPQKLHATHTGRSSQAHAGGYGTHPAQIGVLRPTAYWEAMQDVYHQCYAVLPVGGHLVLVVDKTPCGRTWGTSIGLQGPARCAVEA